MTHPSSRSPTLGSQRSWIACSKCVLVFGSWPRCTQTMCGTPRTSRPPRSSHSRAAGGTTLWWIAGVWALFCFDAHKPHASCAEAIDFIRQLLGFDPGRRMRLSTALTHPWLDGCELQIETPLAYPAVATTPTAGSLSEDVSMLTGEELSFVDVEAPVLTPRAGEEMDGDAPGGEEADAVSQGIQHMRLHGSSAALLPSTAASGDTEPLEHGRLTLTPPSNTPPSLPLVKRGALQRRSEVIQHAAETGQSLVEPSWEMVSYANSQSSQQPKKQDEHEQQVDGPFSPSQEELYGPPRDGDVACVVPTPKANGKTANADASGSGSVTSNGKGSNKRARPLTPLPEDGHDDGDDDERGNGDVTATEASSPLSSAGETPPPREPARKRSRATQDSPPKPPPKGRRGGKAAGAAAAGPSTTRKTRAKVVVDAESEETPVGTRRSTRARSGKR